MIKGGKGGGNTTTGIKFESKVDFLTLIRNIPNYRVEDTPHKSVHDIFYRDELVAQCFKKYGFYRFLDEKGIDWKNMISKRWLPDDALLVVVRDTLFIIEVKHQQVAGSVDEKLQTCDFKRKFYLKLVTPLGLRVEYVYVLNDWFRQPQYKDALSYIQSVNCHYKFNELPLAWLGLPTG